MAGGVIAGAGVVFLLGGGAILVGAGLAIGGLVGGIWGYFAGHSDDAWWVNVFTGFARGVVGGIAVGLTLPFLTASGTAAATATIG